MKDTIAKTDSRKNRNINYSKTVKENEFYW